MTVRTRRRTVRSNGGNVMVSVFWEWLNFAVRWLHVIAGIAWIGSSFYFVHLDSSIKRRAGLPEGAGGSLVLQLVSHTSKTGCSTA